MKQVVRAHNRVRDLANGWLVETDSSAYSHMNAEIFAIVTRVYCEQ